MIATVTTVALSIMAIFCVTGWAEAEATARPIPVVPAVTLPPTTTTTIADFIQGPVVTFAPRPTTTTTTAPMARLAQPAPSAPARPWTWDQLADCETGLWAPGRRPIPGTARWSVTRGIYQGGLQFDAGTWDLFRARYPSFPADAHLASREQQIAVAELVLRAQGAKAWPTCGPRIGMTGTAATSSA